jgi:hypothetical protein
VDAELTWKRQRVDDLKAFLPLFNKMSGTIINIHLGEFSSGGEEDYAPVEVMSQ